MSNATAMREAVDVGNYLRSPKRILKNCFEPYCVKARIFITSELIGITVRRGCQGRRNTLNFPAPKTSAENLLENFRNQVI